MKSFKSLSPARGLLASLLVLFSLQACAEDKTVTLSEAELKALIDERLEQRLKELGLDDAGFDEKVEQGIVNYINKQRQAQRSPSEKAKNLRPVSLPRDHVLGNPDAVISLIEYSDFECPFCKRFHAVPQRIVDEYGGKVNWVYRHFPLSFHNPGAQMQAEASECAAEIGGNASFWKFSDLIYARTQAGGQGFPLDQLLPLAEEIGLNKKKFKECYESRRHQGRVLEDFNEGQAAGVSGTPGNFLRHNKTGKVLVVTGAQPYEEVKAAVEQLLAEGE